MKDFKDSTKVQYYGGGKVSSTKGAAKVAKVMGEFKRGDLHSGSKKGPRVTNPKQAVAIAMSEARKAPMKKATGGAVESGNRMSRENARDLEAVKRTTKPAKKPARDPRMPLIGDSVASGNRMSAQEAAEARALGVYKKGGLAAMPKGKC